MPTNRFALRAAFTLLLCILPLGTARAETLQVDLPPISQPVLGQLKMGGANPGGVRIEANNQFITLGGKPWTPVMGEFHYSRVDPSLWDDGLEKMKAGGITLVSCYIIWIHHEEEQGVFDFEGRKDLRKFIQTCDKHGLKVWLRVGPWAHGEVRNGGIPDWVMKQCGRNIRTTDPAFMGLVHTLYQHVAQQASGLLWKDGGPVVGIQLDNEMRNNPNYLVALKKMAIEVGMDVPLYSMTGWDGARATPQELLMMYGGYPDGFWTDTEPGISRSGRRNYFFVPNRDDSSIAQDFQPGARTNQELGYRDVYPYLCCEIGGGMAISFLRRPLMDPRDIAATALVKLGCGANMLGYYMYHGGTNPPGKFSTLQESQATDYPNDMPELNYDFQAPVGQYGQIHPVYNELRRLHLFIQDYGSLVATMPAAFPANVPKTQDDTQTLRWSARSDGKSGFVFINNYQRGATMAAHDDVTFKLGTAGTIGPVKIAPGQFSILPFNMDLNGLHLLSADAQPLCRLDRPDGPVYVFFASGSAGARFVFGGKTVKLDPPSGGGGGGGAEGMGEVVAQAQLNSLFTASSGDGSARILLLDSENSLHASKIHLADGDHLLISQANVTFDGALHLSTTGSADMNFSIYPKPGSAERDAKALDATPGKVFTSYAVAAAPAADIAVKIETVKAASAAPVLTMGSKNKPQPPSNEIFDAAAAVWKITLPGNALDNTADVWLHIHYTGSIARLFVGDRMIDDDFYYGKPLDVPVKLYPEILTKGLTFKVFPLRNDFHVYIQDDVRPKPGADGQVVSLDQVTASPEYSTTVKLN